MGDDKMQRTRTKQRKSHPLYPHKPRSRSVWFLLFCLLVFLTTCIHECQCEDVDATNQGQEQKQQNQSNRYGDNNENSNDNDRDRENSNDENANSNDRDMDNEGEGEDDGGDDNVDNNDDDNNDDDSDDLIDFYQPDIADDDYDYTISSQTANTYISTISDVVLCLFCTFFWVLWLVGAIFPNKLHDQYREEGVLVKGDVIDSYCRDDDNSDGYGVGLHTYHAVVSYVVPGNVVRGEVRRTGGRDELRVSVGTQPNSNTNENVTTDTEFANAAGKNKTATRTTHTIKHIKGVPMSVPNFPIDAFSDSVPPRSPPSPLHSNDESPSLDNLADNTSNQTSPKRNTGNKTPLNVASVKSGVASENSKNRSLFDTSKSFDSAVLSPNHSQDNGENPTAEQNLIDNRDLQHVNNNNYHHNYYQYREPPLDPELIGGCSDVFGIHFPQFSSQNSNSKQPFFSSHNKSITIQEEESTSPVRVKKRFETSELLQPGKDNVDILVLPGNPTSGILKSEFDEQEIMLHGGMMTGTNSEVGTSLMARNDDLQDKFYDLEGNAVAGGGAVGRFNEREQSSPHFDNGQGKVDECTGAWIGIVLAAVSTGGAVNAALQLPYHTRAYGWMLLVISLSLMWPLAMLTYKTVHRVRIFMMNKIISFEPCAEKSGLYELGKLPHCSPHLRIKGGNASLAGTNTSSVSGTGGGQESNYFIMLESSPHKRTGQKKGVFPQDEDSAVSSLSGDGRLRTII